MSDSQYYQVHKLIAEMGISVEQFCEHTGLSFEALNANAMGTENQRVEHVLAIFAAIDNWFGSPQEAWHWYTKQPIIGFGDFTPSQVVMQNNTAGAHAIIDYIKSKELGGFE